MTQELRWVEALPLADLWEGDFVGVEVAGTELIVVHHLNGNVQAFQGTCPHQEVLLEDGEWNEATGVLICRGHSWEFDLHTGAGINPDDCRLREYPVHIDEERVMVGVHVNSQQTSGDDRGER
jgi:toluene monooxygenase system ferredoxin subunit